MPISTRTLKRRQIKKRIETQLANAITERDLANQEIRNLQETLRTRNQFSLEQGRELQMTRSDLLNARAELCWIAQHAVARTIGAQRIFNGSPINDSDAATKAETPRR